MKSFFLIFVFFIPNDYFDDVLDSKYKTYFFDGFTVHRAKDKKVLAYAKNITLIIQEKDNDLNYTLEGDMTAFDHYPINHRQIIFIKVYLHNQNQFVIQTRLFLHCQSKNTHEIVRGEMGKNLKLKDIYGLELIFWGMKWYKCNDI